METKPSNSKEIIAYLVEKFPACFSIKGPAKPLKVGIFQDLAESLSEDENVSKTRLRQALRHYTSSWRYLKSIKVGAQRVDLAGENVAEIDQEQADYASKTLKESQEKFGNKTKQDKPDKKGYKDSSSEGSADHKKKRQQYKNVKSSKGQPKAKPAKVDLKPVEQGSVSVGSNVKVKLGNAPMDGVITEVSGKDIQVQLTTGMVVKTSLEKIFI